MLWNSQTTANEQVGLPIENHRATFAACLPSALLLVHENPVNELEELRKAHKDLASLIANLEVADGALKIFNLGITAEYIKLAQWHAQQVQKSIEKVGQTKPGAKRGPTEKAFHDTRRKRDNSR